MSTHVSPTDAHIYLSTAKDDGHIRSFKRIQHKKRVLWKIEVPSTHYDDYNGIEWVSIMMTSREVCAFMEGIWAAKGVHPVNRAGAYRAAWGDRHAYRGS